MPFLAGQKVRASQLNELGGGSSGSSNPTGGYAGLTADQTVTSSTTLVEAPSLTFDLAASARYAFHGWLLFTADAAGDLKAGLVAPSGASGYWSALSSAASFSAADLGTAINIPGAGSGTRVVAVIDGHVTTTSAGEMQLHVAQQTSSATATVLRSGSWIRYVRLS